MDVKDVVFEGAPGKALTDISNAVRSSTTMVIALSGEEAEKTTGQIAEANTQLGKAAMSLNRFLVAMCLVNHICHSHFIAFVFSHCHRVRPCLCCSKDGKRMLRC